MSHPIGATVRSGAEPRQSDAAPDPTSDELRSTLAEQLAREMDGEARFDPVSRVIYSSDASSYQIEPLGVAFPRDADDLAAAVSVCARLGVPIVPRGGGSSLVGQSIGAGLVIDTSRHLDAVEIDAEARRARVGPGLVLDRLNAAAGRHGLMFGPDPASSDRACMGGVIGNNATGAHSIVHGMSADHLRAAEVVLADGQRARFAPRGPAEVASLVAGGGLEGRIHAALSGLAEPSAAAVIQRDFPRYWRRAGGYNLDRIVRLALGPDAWPAPSRPPFLAAGLDLEGLDRADEPDVADALGRANRGHARNRKGVGLIDASQVLAGSEGTLAIATELELALVPRPKAHVLLVAQFERLNEAFEAVPPLLESLPSAIELVDRMLLRLAREAPGHAADVSFIQGDPAAVLIVEFAAGSVGEALKRAADARRRLARGGLRGPFEIAEAPAAQARIWRARKAGLGLLARRRGDFKPVAGIEDTAVPPEALADYMAEVEEMLKGLGLEAAFYAHASAGCIHVRPVLNLKTAKGVETLDQLMEAVFALCSKHGGVPSSEHGDGLARSGFNRRLFGDEVYALMQGLKRACDPQGILNPGKVVSADEAEGSASGRGDRPDLRHLRFGPDYRATVPPSSLALPLDGDLLRAAEQCNGAGVCRKLDRGAMCPSFQVSREEAHSPRGRANVVRAALDGRLRLHGIGHGRDNDAALASDEVDDAMDLCNGCKACKTECPSGVDIARLKIEARAARNALRGLGPRQRAFGHIHEIDRWLAPVAPIANVLLRGPWAAPLMRRLGIEPRRRFPKLAGSAARRAWRRRHRRQPASGSGAWVADRDPNRATGIHRGPVVLFLDTFTRFHEPGIGQAALRVLEAAGHRVLLPDPRRQRCCGRPALSQGMIDLAIAQQRANLRLLAGWAEQGLPILVPEPSCASSFRDEMPDLLTAPEDRAAARRVADQVRTLEQHLSTLPEGALPLRGVAKDGAQALLHVHCHQRSQEGVVPALRALARIPGLEVFEPDAGCCGMAGAFGYEAEHYEVSLAMAERKLASAVRELPEGAWLAASGASCRQQIRDVCDREAFHPVEVLERHLAPREP